MIKNQQLLKEKSGSVTVFIMIFFVSLVGMIFVFIDVSKEIATGSAVESLGHLWTNSILAEYDLNLQQRYNIFGFYGLPEDVNGKLDFYGKESFSDKKYIEYEGAKTSLYEYALSDADVMKKQIVKAGKLAFTEKFIKPAGKIESAGEGEEGIIRNEVILSGLPSAGSEKNLSISGIAASLKEINALEDVFEKSSEQYFEIQYIFAYFKNQCNDRDLGKTFFTNEVEYIICGKKSDSANQKAIRNRIVALREVMNLAYLNRDPKKRAEALAAAQLLTPGPAAAATAQALMAAWALAESVNDYRLLLDGHQVSLTKNEATWAVDLDSVLDEKSGNYIYTGVEQGENYEDYLRLFAYMSDERIRLLRIMDLIQINMKYLYYSSFSLKDYSSGLRTVLTVNGEQYEMAKEY